MAAPAAVEVLVVRGVLVLAIMIMIVTSLLTAEVAALDCHHQFLEVVNFMPVVVVEADVRQPEAVV